MAAAKEAAQHLQANLHAWRYFEAEDKTKYFVLLPLPETDNNILVYSKQNYDDVQLGGKKQMIVSNKKINYSNKAFRVYEGSRGAQYIKLNKKYVSLKKLNNYTFIN